MRFDKGVTTHVGDQLFTVRTISTFKTRDATLQLLLEKNPSYHLQEKYTPHGHEMVQNHVSHLFTISFPWNFVGIFLSFFYETVSTSQTCQFVSNQRCMELNVC